MAANHFRAVLVTSELALALILLIGSGLMVKAFWKLQEVDAGMNPNHLLTMRLSLPSVTYKDAASINGFYGGLARAAECAAGRGVGGDCERAASGSGRSMPTIR